MFRKLSVTILCSVALLGRTHGQEVTVARQGSAGSATVELITERSISEHIAEEQMPRASLPKALPKNEVAIVEVPRAKTVPPVANKPAKAQVVAAETVKPQPLKAQPVIEETVKAEPAVAQTAKEQAPAAQPASGPIETAFVRLADGFDFPVGKPEAQGYYKARGYRPNGHQGEDWDGIGGGDTDLGDPIFSIGDGVVVFARDVHMGWGNVVIMRYTYRESGAIKTIDALYGHLNSMLVKRGQKVARGEKIATMGNAHGQYDAHLHLEIRKNLEIGMSRSAFRRDYSNYYDPTQFILAHRRLEKSGAKVPVAMNTFTHDWAFHFDNRNFAPRARNTSQSSAALQRSVATSVR